MLLRVVVMTKTRGRGGVARELGLKEGWGREG
jgi:hypothetical protein